MSNKKYYDSLPKKCMGAGALFFNESGELLILHPTYKDRFEIPGGVVEENESPRLAAEREIKEELNMSVALRQLLCIDYWSNTESRPDSLQFVFFGGVLSKDIIDEIDLDTKEIKNYEFIYIESDEGKERLQNGTRLGPRIAMALKALKNNECLYLENGKLI